MYKYINIIFPHKVKNDSQEQWAFMSVPTLTTNSTAVTTKIKKKIFLHTFWVTHVKWLSFTEVFLSTYREIVG
jgi:hypothetical protein